MLKHTLPTGVSDGFATLDAFSQSLPLDRQFQYCKFALLNRYTHSNNWSSLKDDAGKCYDAHHPANTPAYFRSEAIIGISGFVRSETQWIFDQRRKNQFHYAWSAPFLPFSQAEVNLFIPHIHK